MFWTFLNPIVSAGLTIIIFWFWKPWAKAYSEEKGKTLARKEDLDSILAEVRAITAAQKGIESKLSSELWDQQVRWNQKRDIYAELIKAAQDLSYAFVTMAAGLRDTPTTDNEKMEAQKRFVGLLDKITNAQEALTKAAGLASIFADDDCEKELRAYVDSRRAPAEKETLEWVLQQAEDARSLRGKLISIAKKDLKV